MHVLVYIEWVLNTLTNCDEIGVWRIHLYIQQKTKEY